MSRGAWKSAAMAGVLLAVVVGLAPTAKAGFFTGNDLLTKCQGTTLGSSDVSLCLGYVVAVADSLDWSAFVDLDGAPGCVPGGVTAGQLKDVVIKALLDDPANRNVDAYLLTESAFIRAWHCKVPPTKHKQP